MNAGRFRFLIAALAVAMLLVLGLAAGADPAAMALASAELPAATWLLALGAVALIFIAAGTPGRARTIVARALVPLMAASFITLGFAYVDQHDRLVTVVDATELLITKLAPLPADAEIYAVGEPYPAGRTLQLRQEDGTESTATIDATTWLFMVDLAPAMLRGHPIRYAFLSDTAVRTQDAEWFAFVDGAPGWTLTGVLEVGGHNVGVIAPTSSAASSVAPDAITRLGHELGRGRSAAAADGTRKAIVVDGGDKWIAVPTGMPPFLWQKLKQIEARIEMRLAADELQRQLSDRGYAVTRFAAGETRGAPPPTRDAIAKAIADGAAGMKAGDELYLHLIAHGGIGGLGLYTERASLLPSGRPKVDFTREDLSYADLAGMLRDATKRTPG